MRRTFNRLALGRLCAGAGWLGLSILHGCAASGPPAVQATRSASPAPAAYPSLAPLPLEAEPYRPPDFQELPPEAAFGRWERLWTRSSALAGPSPTPPPLPQPLSEATVEFSQRNPTRAEVGETLTLRASTYTPTGETPPFTWGLKSTDRARIDAEGRLTVTAPGPNYVSAEVEGKRRYMLIAGVAKSADVRRLFTWEIPYGRPQPWSSLLQSRDEWDRYWQAAPKSAYVTGPPELPEDVDFTRQTIVAVAGIRQDGDAPPEITHLTPGDAPIAHLTVPNWGPSVTNELPSPYITVFLLPKQRASLQVDRAALSGGASGLVPLDSPDGPPPTPAPSPSPTPNPNETTQPGESRAAPPYAPPTPPPASDTGCPPADMFYSNTAPRPLTLRWADIVSTSDGEQPWEPILRVGQTTRLIAATQPGPVSWRVADPRLASITANGTLTALSPGAILVTAESNGHTARAMVACVVTPDPAIAFHFYRDYATPADAAPRTARVISSLPAWAEFWKTSFFNPLPGSAPEVDFARRDLVTLVDDRLRWGESMPVLTHVSDNGTVPHIVFPGIEGQAGISYGRQTYLYQVGKLQPGGRVQVHTLCSP